MQSLKVLTAAVTCALIAACSSGSNTANTGTTPPPNTNGTPVNGTIIAQFDSAKGQLPFPNNLLFSGSTDGTLNPPVVNPANTGDPAVALSALDGFGTLTPWSTTFSAEIDPATVVAGQTVRFFEVTRPSPLSLGVNAVVRELAAGVDFVTAISASTEAVVAGTENSGKTGIRLAVVPTKALDASSLVVSGTTAVPSIKTYMVVLTKGIKDRRGNDATPDTTYFLAKRTSPLVVGTCPSAAGPGDAASTDPLLPVANACALEPVRQLVNAQEALAVSRGMVGADIILSWTASTQYVTPTLGRLRAAATAQASRIASSGLTTGQLGLGLPAIADVLIGITPVNYYLTAPGVAPEGSAAGTAVASPTAVLTGFWQGTLTIGGARNMSFQNSLPQRNSVQNVPLLMTVPNAASNRTKPATGWPIVIYSHGITRNRTDMLAISTTFANAGWAVVAIDQPLHGLDRTSPFYIKGTPFGPLSNERTFDVDLINNTTGASGPDGVTDSSGAHFINLGSLLTSRDNNRQSQVDLIQLVKNISTMDIDGDSVADFNAGQIGYVGQSLGSINLIPAMAAETSVNVGVLSVPGGGIAQLLNGSPTFGPRIRAGLAAGAGLQQGTSSFDQYFTVTQTVIDAADPVNWAKALVIADRVLVHEVVGSVPATDASCALTSPTAPANGCPDAVIPNRVAGAPLSGTEPLIATMGIPGIATTTQNAAGIRGAVRFLKGDHGSLLSPAKDGPTTVEMQTQMANMIASGGTAVPVTNASVVKPN
jgi:Bacterial virulence factor lipase N-terminal